MNHCIIQNPQYPIFPLYGQLAHSETISFPESLFPLTSGRKTRGTKTQGTRLTVKGRILIGSLNAVRTQIVKMDCSGKAMVLLTMKPWVPST